MQNREQGVPIAAEWLFLAAAVLHMCAVPGHAQEWIGYGVFFAVIALAQGLYSLLLPRLGHDLVFLTIGVLSTLSLLVLWLDSRLWHPLVGPHRLHAEPFGVLDVSCAVVEMAALFLLARSTAALLRRRTTRDLELTWT